MEYKATLKTLEHDLSGKIDKTYIYSSPFSGRFALSYHKNTSCMNVDRESQ
ncbi:hypothetical protein ACJIZ3_021202 [Penstemon smallii]|uniref:Uncharacterized protein n=1 Tax=Penstemon smallii TaxID=265156 RepID=A0ABD3SKZ4_9LAMI